MKQFLISMYILLSLMFVSTPLIHAQEEEENGITYEENIEINENVQDSVTLDETFTEITPKLTFIQVLFAILAPITFITIAYLLIKKLKL